MNEPKPPVRPSRSRKKPAEPTENSVDANPYRDAQEPADANPPEKAARAPSTRRRSTSQKSESPPEGGPQSGSESYPDIGTDVEASTSQPRRTRAPRAPRATASDASDAAENTAASGNEGERNSAASPSDSAESRAHNNGSAPQPTAQESAPPVRRSDSGDLNARLERLDRMDRIERGEPVDQIDREQRPPQTERTDRGQRGDRPDRQADNRAEGGERPERPDRGGRPDHRGRRNRHQRNDRGPRDDRQNPPARETTDSGVTDRPEAGGARDSSRDGARDSSRDGARDSSRDGARDRPDRGDRSSNARRSGRRGRSRARRGGPREDGASTDSRNFDRNERGPAAPVTPEGTMEGWFDSSRDSGFLRKAENSYLPDPGDPFVSAALVRQHQLRRGDKLEISYGKDQRGRSVTVEITGINDVPPGEVVKRPDFNTLTASYPDRKLTLETGRPAKTGPELTRRAIDLIAPIGYGQRALIVAPARAGKTTLLQAIVEGVAVNHPEAILIVLLVDERPEEVSEMITWGYGEVVASSFDMPPKRHVEVADMALERARRQVELGKDVVIVLDSITRLARAHNTVDRGTGRTMSGGLDSNAMQKPKAFFGSARMIAEEHGGGSLTIIATALVETGSRMDDVIFEEFKGTGNSEIKLDRSLADRRIFPAFDIATSGTRREEKLYRPDQLEKVHLLRRGLHQMPPQAAMEWLIKRIAGTPNNDSLLDGL